jgi:hypothetical protein
MHAYAAHECRSTRRTQIMNVITDLLAGFFHFLGWMI